MMPAVGYKTRRRLIVVSPRKPRSSKPTMITSSCRLFAFSSPHLPLVAVATTLNSECNFRKLITLSVNTAC